MLSIGNVHYSPQLRHYLEIWGAFQGWGPGGRSRSRETSFWAFSLLPCEQPSPCSHLYELSRSAIPSLFSTGWNLWETMSQNESSFPSIVPACVLVTTVKGWIIQIKNTCCFGLDFVFWRCYLSFTGHIKSESIGYKKWYQYFRQKYSLIFYM